MRICPRDVVGNKVIVPSPRICRIYMLMHGIRVIDVEKRRRQLRIEAGNNKSFVDHYVTWAYIATARRVVGQVVREIVDMRDGASSIEEASKIKMHIV